MNDLSICNYLLLVYVCILVLSWIILDQSRYLYLVELGALLILIFVCEKVYKRQKANKELKNGRSG